MPTTPTKPIRHPNYRGPRKSGITNTTDQIIWDRCILGGQTTSSLARQLGLSVHSLSCAKERLLDDYASRELRRQATSTKALRKCLAHDHTGEPTFMSDSPANRICPACRAKQRDAGFTTPWNTDLPGLPQPTRRAPTPVPQFSSGRLDT